MAMENLVTDEMLGERVSVFMMSGVKNVGKVANVDSDFVEITFMVESRDKGTVGAPSSDTPKREMRVTLRQDRIESVGVLN